MTNRRNIYIFHRPIPEVTERVEILQEKMGKNGFTVVNHPKEANIIASFGNDGTFLQAVRKTNFRDDCLYAGISADDKLSLYCDYSSDDIISLMEAMSSNNLKVRRYPILDVTIDQQSSYYCINEFSIQSNIVKTFAMDVYINDLHFETFRGDGLIVSTPTGSSGYNKSVNGAVVDPLLPCMQVAELGSLNNNQYRTLGSPFILGKEKVLTLLIHKDGNEHPSMATDNEALGIRHVEKIEIKISDKKIKILKLKDNSFWHRVKRTFL